MKYEKLEKLSAEGFRRATGVKKKTFAHMVIIIKEADQKRLHGIGRPATLSIQDQIVMTLEYLREYRTYYHIGIDYSVGESSAFRIIRRIEDALVKSRVFALPSRSSLMDPTIEKVIVDATESPIERPQKNKGNTTPERKRSTLSRHNW